MHFRLKYILESLIQDPSPGASSRRPEELAWLTRSYKDPAAFFNGLMADLQTAHKGLKSAAFAHYDFYYDIFSKQDRSEDTAYIYYDVNGGRQGLTYRALQDLVDRKAAQWAARGVEPGSAILLVHPPGPDLCIKVVAALKLGLVISLGFPSRPWLLKQQAAALAPDYISTARAFTGLLAGHEDRIIETMPQVSGSPAGDLRPHTFQTGQTAARLFDFSLETPLEPVDISCDELYLNALRDGMVAMNLRPGRILSLPGWPGDRTMPFLFLSVLLAHATFLDVKPGQLQETPRMFAQDGPDVLGITPRFRDVLWGRPEGLPEDCRFWFRPQGSDFDLDSWQDFIAAKGLEKVPAGVLKYHTQAGGVLAFSRRPVGIARAEILPSAGMNWQILPLPDTAMMPSPTFGVLSLSAGGVEKQTPYLFIKTGADWICPRSILNEKGGRHFPAALVESFIRESGFRPYFLIIATPRLGPAALSQDLVIFTGSNAGTDHAMMKDMITTQIKDNLGHEYCPDHVTFLPLLPRLMPDGSMDREWCRNEYTANRLAKRAGNGIMKQLSRLKEMVLIQNKINISQV